MRGPLWLVFTAAAVSAAADPSFVFEATDAASYTKAYLGNGEIGLSTSPSGLAAAECFVAGVYDHASGDVPRIAVAPAWNEVSVSNGRISMDGQRGLRAWQQTLDMREGALSTEYEWNDGDRSIAFHIDSFVSRANPSLGAVRVRITPAYSGPVVVRLPLRAWPAPARYPLERLQKLSPELSQDQWKIWYPGRMIPIKTSASASRGTALLQMESRAEGTAVLLDQAVALTWPPGLPASARKSGTEAVVEIPFQAQAGRAYTFTKFAVLLPSFENATREREAAERAQSAAGLGWDVLFQTSAGAWRRLWESDIIVEGDPELQRVVHSMLFHLLGSASATSTVSIPPMGLATAGYYGHYFWDADSYMFPPLLLLHPDIAAPMIAFRSRTLSAARANAAKNGYKGAMYPWEASTDGSECTPRFAFQNALYENHVNGDVALAAWWYYLATDDRLWLENAGFPIIHDTADFWVSRVTFNPKEDRYEIRGVVSVNESLIGVHNDAFTNAVARKNLELASLAARTLSLPVNPKWEEVASKLWIPRMDMPLIDYPLEYALSAAVRDQIARDLRAHPPDGAMMGGEFAPILGVELHDVSLIDALLPHTWKPYVRPPFNVLPETPKNANINFITGAGGFLQQFLYGYSGMRLTEGGFSSKYGALLPSSVSRMVLKGVTVRGARRDYIVKNGSVQ